LAAVQNQFSLTFFHTSREERAHCGTHGIAFVPFSPLGGTGGGARGLGRRFPQVAQIAEAHGVGPQRVVVAWERSLRDPVIPNPGAARPASITDPAAAMTRRLSEDQLDAINAISA